MQTPDFMPVLSAGPHSDPKEGACLMEYVSVLAGEKFRDLPACTSRYIALQAQAVNDLALDEDRHLLLPLIPRLMRTGGPHPWDAPPGSWESPLGDVTAREFQLRWAVARNGSLSTRRSLTIHGVRLLSDMIDEYWRVLGEPEPQGDDLTAADYELMVTAVKQ